MSSLERVESAWVGWLLLAGCAAAALWYAHNQLLFSLVFIYQLAGFVLGL